MGGRGGRWLERREVGEGGREGGREGAPVKEGRVKGRVDEGNYKRGEPYLCSAKAPVLDGSGSRR